MNIKVRFTAPEDLDLIALVHSGVRMGLVIRDVLRAYVRQEIFYVPMPNTIKCINTENTSVNFILNSEKDGDVIAFLRSIRNGYKTVVIKNILRSYFTAPIMEPLKNDAFPIRVNLCWPDDLDLIILAQTQDMQELTLKALSAYVHKAKFSIDTPAIAASINADTMSFTLDLAQEADATISSFYFQYTLQPEIMPLKIFYGFIFKSLTLLRIWLNILTTFSHQSIKSETLPLPRNIFDRTHFRTHPQMLRFVLSGRLLLRRKL